MDPTVDRRQYLTVQEVAELCSLSRQKVYDDIRKGALVAYTFNGSIRIRRADFLAYAQPVSDLSGLSKPSA